MRETWSPGELVTAELDTVTVSSDTPDDHRKVQLLPALIVGERLPHCLEALQLGRDGRQSRGNPSNW